MERVGGMSGKILYEFYETACFHALPSWDQLTQDERNQWDAAARSVRDWYDEE